MKKQVRWAGTGLLLLIGLGTMAQERNYPEYRSKKEFFVRMQEKDIRSDLASFTYGGMDESIGKGSLYKVPFTAYTTNSITFSGNNIQVIIRSGDFDETKHKLNLYNKEYLVKINNKPYYGNYGEVPGTVVTGVTVLIGKDTVAIPFEAYGDLYEPQFTYTDGTGKTKTYSGVYLSADKHSPNIYIHFLNRNVKGGYEVTWVIKDKKYLRRVLDWGFFK